MGSHPPEISSAKGREIPSTRASRTPVPLKERKGKMLAWVTNVQCPIAQNPQDWLNCRMLHRMIQCFPLAYGLVKDCFKVPLTQIIRKAAKEKV